jgi:excisionase family DNA binding protein
MRDLVEKEPDYWIPREFAAVVRLSDKSVYRLLKDPSFPHVRVGGAVRIPRARARRWLAKRTQGAVR